MQGQAAFEFPTFKGGRVVMDGNHDLYKLKGDFTYVPAKI